MSSQIIDLEEDRSFNVSETHYKLLLSNIYCKI